MDQVRLPTHRSYWFCRIVFILILFFPLFSVTTFAEVDLIPRGVLFGNPEKVMPQISPDSRAISYLAPFKGVLNIWVRSLAGHDDRPITHDAGRGIRTYFWAHDNRHILYLQDTAGDENWRLCSVDVKTLKVRDYTPFENVQVRIVDVDKNFPNTILISMNKENKAFHDVYRLDLTTGQLKMIAKNTGSISDWVPDARQRIVGAVASRTDGGTDFLVRNSENDPWKRLTGWSLRDGMANGPLIFSRDGRAVYLKDSTDSDMSRLKKMSLDGGAVQILAEDPDCDLRDVMFEPDTYEPQLVTFEKDRIRYTVLDPSIREDVDLISKIEPVDFSIVSRDNANKIWLISFIKDTGSPVYYVFSRVTKKAVFLFKSRPALDEFTLAPMESVQVISRDGFVLYGYITFPPGRERSGLPMVLNVHGGPWSRDSWGYNGQAQWLANRGYICLQVNFRGSTGFGKKFVNAADKAWGGAMQEDLVDAVRWAIEKGYADPEKIGIYGGSYGGYASLAGATFTPDLFHCAVDVVGPSNLITFLNTIPPYWSVYKSEFYRRVGNPDTDRELLKSRSPFFHTERIKIPILIAQGANDPRVNRVESEQIVAALKKRGIDHEYLLFPDEGHGFARPENRLKFYTACERFLAKHLGGRFEAGVKSEDVRNT